LQKLLESGLAARLLLAMPPTVAGRWRRQDISAAAEKGIEDVYARLLALRHTEDSDGEPEPVILRFTDGGEAVWEAWYDQHAEDLEELESERLRSAWSKLEGYCARLALLLALVDGRDAVDSPHMDAVAELVAWLESECRRVYALLAGAAEKRDPDRALMAWIARRSPPGVTARDLSRGPRQYRGEGGTERAEAALERLAEEGRLERVYETPPAGGHAVTRYRPATAATATVEPDGRDIPQRDRASVAVASVATPELDGDGWPAGRTDHDPPGIRPGLQPKSGGSRRASLQRSC
jgi:hypothetical protein